MFVDARSVPTGSVIETEVCIVGARRRGNYSGAGVCPLQVPRDPVRKRRCRAGAGHAGFVCRQRYRTALRPLRGLAASLLRRHHQPLGRSLVRYAEFARFRNARGRPVFRLAILPVISRAVVSARTTGPQTRSLWLCAFRLGHRTKRYSRAVPWPAFRLPRSAARPGYAIWP